MRRLGRIRPGLALALAAFGATMLLCAPALAATHDIRFDDVLDGNVPGVSVSGLRGNGNYGKGDSLVGSFTNETGETLRMYVPPGMYFSPSDSAYQPLITGGCVVEIPPTRDDQTAEVGMTAFCGDSGAHVPSSGTGFTYEGFVPDDQRRLLENAEREETDRGTLQGYVWQMTNGTGEPLDEGMRQLLEGGQVQPGQVAAAGAAAAGAAAGGQLLMNRTGGGSGGQTPPPQEGGIPSGDLGADGPSGEESAEPTTEGEGEPEKPPPEGQSAETDKADSTETGDKKPDAEGDGGKPKDKPKPPEWLIFTDPQTGRQTWQHGNDVYRQDDAGRWVRQADADKPGGASVTVGGANVGEQGGVYSASRDRGGHRTDVLYDRGDHAGGFSDQQGRNRTSGGFDDGRTDLTITRGRGEGERTTSGTFDNRDGSADVRAQQGDNVLHATRAAGGDLGLDITRDRGDVDRQTGLRYSPTSHDGSFSQQQGDNKLTLSHEGDRYTLEANRDRDVHDRSSSLTYDLADGTGGIKTSQGDNEFNLTRDDKGGLNLSTQRDRGEGTRNLDASWRPDTGEGGFTSREGDNLLSANRRADGTVDVAVGRSRANIGEEPLTRGASYNPETGDASVQVGQGERDAVSVSRTGDRTEVSVTRPRGEEGTIKTTAAFDSSRDAGAFTQVEGRNRVDLTFDPDEYRLTVNSERPEGQAFNREFVYRPQEESGQLTLGNIKVGHEEGATFAQVGPRTLAYDSEQRMGGFAWETPKGDGYTGVKFGERWGVEGSRPLGSGNIEWNYEQGGPKTREWGLEWSIGEGDEQWGVGVQTDSTGHPMPTVRGTVKF